MRQEQAARSAAAPASGPPAGGLPTRERPPLPQVSFERIVDHIDHVVKLVGPAHVGIGPDFFDAAMPLGMEDCTGLPKITEALVRRGYRDDDVRAILGGNILRVMEDAERVAGRMQGQTRRQ